MTVHRAAWEQPSDRRADPRKVVPLPGQASPFGALLRRLRIRLGLSQNALAHAAGVDPAYVNRLERATAETTSLPSRKVVLALWESLQTGEDDRERLLVAAGLCPDVILQAGGWDAYRDRFRRAMDTAVLALEAAFRGDADAAG